MVQLYVRILEGIPSLSSVSAACAQAARLHPIEELAKTLPAVIMKSGMAKDADSAEPIQDQSTECVRPMPASPQTN